MKIKEIVRKIQYISIKELNEMAMNPSLRDLIPQYIEVFYPQILMKYFLSHGRSSDISRTALNLMINAYLIVKFEEDEALQKVLTNFWIAFGRKVLDENN
jgi:hypothetical protein